MKKKTKKSSDEKCDCGCKCHHHCKGGAVYFLGFIGSAVYYIQTATGFWNGVVGVLKAIVWPAILVYKFLIVLGA